MKTILSTFIIITLLFLRAYGQSPIEIDGFIMSGILLTPPNATDLDYSANMGSCFTAEPLQMGLGAKTLIKLPLIDGVQGGFDLGARTLFHSRTQCNNSPESSSVDSEYEASILAIIRMSKPSLPIFFESGAGLHLVFWEYYYEYNGTYIYTDNYDNGLDANLGLMLGTGMKLPIMKHLNLMISLRTDYIFRYDGFLNFALNLGIALD